MPPAHLISQDAKRVHVAGRRSSSIGQSEASRVNQFRGSAVEKPIHVHPWHDGWNGSHSETSDADTPIGVDENIGLGGHKRATEAWGGGRAYNFDIPMHDVEAM